MKAAANTDVSVSDFLISTLKLMQAAVSPKGLVKLTIAKPQCMKNTRYALLSRNDVLSSVKGPGSVASDL